ncbi:MULTISPECIES: enediyne antibiotic chromoprotein [Actinomycetes]|uniref:enediyne antibiotic chromoprotein n=1 Tax=Actinomycetes TaxID=1760 RepID=UPI0001B54A5D|nr:MULTISPECIES: enediyne antibiotic chromoprotein [Actinomycetes]
MRALCVLGGATAVATALAFPQIAAASPSPSISATPSTGLTDGTVVTATVNGFTAGGTVQVSECAIPSAGLIVCDKSQVARITTDATGSASTTVTARKSFTGYTLDGTQWGPVDCPTVPGGCLIGAVDQPVTVHVGVPISFQ